MNGVVTRAIIERGFAFVRGDDGLDYFLHADDLAIDWNGDAVRSGLGVRFKPVMGPKGPRAIEAAPVERLSENPR